MNTPPNPDLRSPGQVAFDAECDLLTDYSEAWAKLEPELKVLYEESARAVRSQLFERIRRPCKN